MILVKLHKTYFFILYISDGDSAYFRELWWETNIPKNVLSGIDQDITVSIQKYFLLCV